MDYTGYNGTISVEGDVLTITHSGFVAKSAGLPVDKPRTIPLAAVSGVFFAPATRLINGHLTLGLGGAAAEKLKTSAVADNPDTVMFRFKDKDRFAQLHEWLVSVIDHNRAAGVDPAAVDYDAAGQTRIERMQASQEARQEAKATQLVGDDRPDITAAAAQMNWRFGGKRELKNLASHLHDGETVRRIAQGTYENNQGILVLTDVRLLFLFHGIVGQAKEDFPLKLISSVQTKKGFASGELKIFVSGNNAVISGVINTDLDPLADALREGMAKQHAPAHSPDPARAASQPAEADPFETMQKLASLRDAGILTDDEFEAKKKDILDRM